MVDDRDRTPRRGGTDVRRESVEDILARNGLGGAASGPHTSTGGRAARRRAAEEQERALSDAAPPPPRAPQGGRHSARAPQPEPVAGP
ncbi:hypothetical protein, partial [Pseudonocardia lacus]|uniref:hypothetical protein n=1 Tax=Pseudonocardia lacus TaxID=2835865 RepID=UPI0038B53DB3